MGSKLLFKKKKAEQQWVGETTNVFLFLNLKKRSLFYKLN